MKGTKYSTNIMAYFDCTWHFDLFTWIYTVFVFRPLFSVFYVVHLHEKVCHTNLTVTSGQKFSEKNFLQRGTFYYEISFSSFIHKIFITLFQPT